jgi:hypothetical protein
MENSEMRQSYYEGALITAKFIEEKLNEFLTKFESEDGVWILENELNDIPREASLGFLDGIKFTINHINCMVQDMETTNPFERN